MPITFPITPSNEDTYTEGSITWEYNSTNNSWTVLTLVPAGLDNGIDHHLELIYLYNAGVAAGPPTLPSTNLQTPATGLTYDPDERTLRVKERTGQTQNLFEVVNRNGVFLNGFNLRGTLEKAGKIFYQASAPTPAPDAGDPGILWFDSDDVFLKVWNGTAWVTAAGNVTLNGTETFTGPKTFSNADLILSGTSEIVGTGSSKSISLKPTNAGSSEVSGITVASNQITIHQPLELDSLTTNSKAIVATLGDVQTFTAVKTFSSGLISSAMSATTSTSSAANGSISITASKNAASRGIVIDQNADGSTGDGIQIKATNEANQGRLTITGEVYFEDDIILASGSTITGTVIGPTVRYGQWGSSSVGAVDPQTQTIIPETLGPFTFSSSTAGEMLITNTSSRQASLTYTREQYLDALAWAKGIRKITISAGGVAKVFANSGEVTQMSGTVTNSRLYGTITNTDRTQLNPILIAVALA